MSLAPSNRRRSSGLGTRVLLEALEQRQLLSTILVATQPGNLYSVDTTTGTATLIGNMGNGVDQIGSYASSSLTGNLYAADADLYQINPAAAAATDIGPTGVEIPSLAVSPTGVIYGASTALYLFSTATGAATLVGNMGLPRVGSANSQTGDLAFDTSGNAYVAAQVPNEPSGDQLFSLNTTTGAATLIGSIGFTGVTGLARGDDGLMYGVTSDSKIITVDTSTGAGTFAANLTGTTGAITDAASLVSQPPPASTPPAASFTSSTYTANLNSTAAVLTVQLTGSSATADVRVQYHTIDGTAKAGIDYVAESGVIDFPLGITTQQLLIPVLNSQSLGVNRDFQVQLTDTYTDNGGDPSVAPYVLVAPDTADVTIQNVNSAFQISPATVSVSDASKNATITVQRLGITSDEETVDFATVYPSSVPIGNQATPGVNYSPVRTTIDFQPGQTSQTISVPILPDASAIGSTENVLLQLSNPQVIPPATGSATAQNLFVLGSPNSTLPVGTGLLTISNVDFSQPSIESLTVNSVGKKITSITLKFSKALSQASAEALSSYGIFNRNSDGPYGSGSRRGLKLGSAVYNSSDDTVVLTPKHPLRMNKIYQFVAYGTDGVTDQAGRPLQNNSSSTSAGPNYSTFFGQGNKLTYTDADGDRVRLKLTHGGTMDLRRAFDGDASSLILNDTTPSSILSGTVKRGKHGDGLTTIDLVGPTGGVNDLLTNPPFIIINLQ